MNEETQKYYDIMLERMAKVLQNRGFDTAVCQTGTEALGYLQNAIGRNDIIGYGGSKSMDEIGFFTTFTTDKYPNIIDRNKPNLTQDEKIALWRKALTADVFLASPNAVALSGEMIFIDKNGNRNAGVTYGPKHVYLLVGRNKIVESLEAAIARAQDVAAVKNNIRFNTGNPCTKTGHCMHCMTENTLCSVTTILQYCFPIKTKTVVLINEELGF